MCYVEAFAAGKENHNDLAKAMLFFTTKMLNSRVFNGITIAPHCKQSQASICDVDFSSGFVYERNASHGSDS